MQGDATFSSCRLYRYQLTRSWREGERVNFIMLNPSTADATKDDPTIRRCIGFAKAWGYGGLVVTNLYGYRTKDPARLRLLLDPIGSENDLFIKRTAAEVRLVVCAWGNHGVGARSRQVLRLIREAGRIPHAFGLTLLRQPMHPLYIQASRITFPL